MFCRAEASSPGPGAFELPEFIVNISTAKTHNCYWEVSAWVTLFCFVFNSAVTWLQSASLLLTGCEFAKLVNLFYRKICTHFIKTKAS